MNNFSRDNDLQRDNATDSSEDVSHRDYIEYRVAQSIWMVCPPCILLVGGFGNIATICVMRRIKDHNSSQYAILMSLAVSDLAVLVTGPPRFWVWFIVQVDLEELHVAVCKLCPFVVYGSNTTSAWLVTCVTVQRTMAVLWPHRMRAMCTVRRTWIVIAALVFSASALNVHFLIGHEITGSGKCSPVTGSYQRFYYYHLSWIDLCLASLLPSVCLIICDVILAVSLFRAVPTSSISASVESTVNTAQGTDSRRITFYRTTVMVLAISCTFLILTLPACVRIVWYYYNYDFVHENPKTEAMDNLVKAVTYQMWHTNSAINFVLYCLTGTKFRREFLHWIRCCCGAQSPSDASVHEAASEASREGRHQHIGTTPLSK